MGLSDEMYALAIERMHEEQRMEALRAQKDLLKAQLNLEATRIKAAQATPTASAHPYQPKLSEPRMYTDDLDHEAAKVSLDTLKDMWIMRWQDNWVGREEFTNDDFWRIAFVRLENVNKLERHMLFDRMEYVYRIIE